MNRLCHGWDHARYAEPAGAEIRRFADAARGVASELVLLAYGRRKPDDGRYEVAGEEVLLASWFENSAI